MKSVTINFLKYDPIFVTENCVKSTLSYRKSVSRNISTETEYMVFSHWVSLLSNLSSNHMKNVFVSFQLNSRKNWILTFFEHILISPFLKVDETQSLFSECKSALFLWVGLQFSILYFRKKFFHNFFNRVFVFIFLTLMVRNISRIITHYDHKTFYFRFLLKPNRLLIHQFIWSKRGSYEDSLGFDLLKYIWSGLKP